MKAKRTNISRYGKSYYSEIGKLGGKAGHTGGFASNPQQARVAGQKGGKSSRRGPRKIYLKKMLSEKPLPETFRTAKEARTFIQEEYPNARKMDAYGNKWSNSGQTLVIKRIKE